MKRGFHEEGTTIVAVASPPGRSPRGILRLSGPGAWPSVASLVDLPAVPPAHHISPCSVQPPSIGVPVPAFLVWMPAPRSYTREDMVELHTFGSPVLLATLCDAILTNGARLASPGEFTRRAFLHGRIDLTQAEAVLEVIHAQSESEHRQALEHLRGALHRRIHARKESLIHLSALCEAAIDFSDQDIEVVEGDHVEREIDAALRDVAELLSAARVRPPTGEGVRVAIIGRPNVGKSSLLNCLAGRPVAIVSPHPGTTRDTVEHPLRIEGIEFRLRDSAGIRRPQDPLEAAGIERSQSILESSDLILLVIDGSVPVTEDDCRLAAEADASRTVLVVSKDDLSPVARLDDLPEPMRSRIPCRTSARTGVGIGELRGRMAEAIESGAAAGASPSFLVNARQRGCLLDASRSLASARDAAGAGAGLELIALDLRDALDHLGEVVGEVVTEDILDVIFSRFCIGK